MRREMIEAVHCEAKKHAFRQTQDGVIISFVLHPQEVPPELALAPLGTRVMLAVAEIGDDEQPLPAKGEERAKRVEKAGSERTNDTKNNRASELGRERYLLGDDGEKAVIRAALLAKNPRFQDYHGCLSERDAADLIRAQCGVRSRREIASNEQAYNCFRDIEFEFHGFAEQRG